MSFLTIFLIGVGLSADAFAASVTSGIRMHRLHYGRAGIIALTFGLFQAVMPLLGWLLATSFADLIEPVDHWIAFGLLALLGGKMVWDALFGGPEDDDQTTGDAALRQRLIRLLVLGFATSIDAAAVGVSLAVLNVAILPAIVVIGATTFVIAFAGVLIGYQVGRFRKPAEIIGGVVLIAIGVRILIEHLSA